MPRAPRRYIANKPFELTLRTREGLPFVATQLMVALIKGVLARSLRQFNLKLCVLLWMANHAHLIVVCKDAQLLQAFHAEVKKKLTEIIKRLLNLEHLDLWEERDSVPQILSKDFLRDRIAYFFANPARANLVDSIEKYPHLSSWNAFIECMGKGVHAAVHEKVTWIREATVTELPSEALTEKQDEFILKELLSMNEVEHTLTFEPNAWLACFGEYSDEEELECNKLIIERLRKKEQTAREARAKSGKSLLGARALRTQSMSRRHTPPARRRRLIYLTNEADTAEGFLESFRRFVILCRDAYYNAKCGLRAVWPPGAFRPSMCPLSNSWSSAPPQLI